MAHKDVEYAVDDTSGTEHVFQSYAKAAEFAVNVAFAQGEAVLDVLVYSRAGAKHHAGGDGVAQWDDDPEASVFDRIEIKVNHVGKVP